MAIFLFALVKRHPLSMQLCSRSCDGTFRFQLDWTPFYKRNEWIQTNDPTKPGPVTGYQGKFKDLGEV